MKKIYNTFFLLVCVALVANAQKVTEKLNYNYNVSAYKDIRIHNFDGDVTIKATRGNELALKVTKITRSKSQRKLEAAREEVYLDTTVIDGEFIVFMVAPNRFFKMDDEGNSFYKGDSWDNWQKSSIQDYGVKYEFIIEATVPADKNIWAATHYDDVLVEGINGNTVVKSHHGSVKAVTGGDEVVAKTHHGDVEVVHTSNAVTHGVYKTHHGDITTSFPQLSADVSMKSHHGSFYIDFPYNHIAQKVNKLEDGRKTKYKIGGKTSIRVGNGKGELTYATHHGNTYISKGR